MKKYGLFFLCSVLLSGCMPLYLLWAELNPREAYQQYWGGRNIDPVPKAEIDRTILAQEFEGVCQPRAYLDGTPLYSVIRLDGVDFENKYFRPSGLRSFKNETIDTIDSSKNKEENCKKLLQCLSNISTRYIEIGEYPFALLYSDLKNGKNEHIRSSVIETLHSEFNNRFSIQKCLVNPEEGEYYFYSAWFNEK